MRRLTQTLPSLLLVAVITHAAAAAVPFRFGEYRLTIGDLSDPRGVAIGPDDMIYVTEAGADRIMVFRPDGSYSHEFGSTGDGPGELRRPSGIAVTADGTVFVCDTGNHRVEVFDTDGMHLRSWGRLGTRPSRFNEPRGIAVSGRRAYVTDLGNRRVQVFDLRGALISAEREQRFGRPVGVAVDGAGAIFVVDADRNGVTELDAKGKPVRAWGDWGPFLGLMDTPSAIVSLGDHRYVADTRNHRVQVFDAEGEMVEQWGVHATAAHEGDGSLHYPDALAIAPSGAFGVIGESFENRLQIFDAAPTDAPPPDQTAVLPQRRMKAHFGERIDLDGKLLTVAEPENYRVYVFELSRDVPVVIGDFGERGRRPGQSLRIAGLELDVEGRWLHVTDTAAARLSSFGLQYEPDEPRGYSRKRAKFVRSWDIGWLAEQSATARRLKALGVKWTIEPAAIRHDADGNVYLLDPRNAMIIVFDESMKLLRAWGGHGAKQGQFRRPTDLVFGRTGEELFVVDADNHRIQVFDREGEFVRAWGVPGEAEGRFRSPFGITADDEGFVYVTDDVLHRIQKFGEDGTFMQAWGELGTDHGQMWKPKGLGIDQRNRIYVVDYGNHRAQVFSTEGEWLVSFGTGRAYTKWDKKPTGDGS
ncbi:MAG: hypothetical protein ACYTGP_02510 [Planctomycetota bacterium]|jgi:DNA-binding beta-propeller fold protein YncE